MKKWDIIMLIPSVSSSKYLVLEMNIEVELEGWNITKEDKRMSCLNLTRKVEGYNEHSFVAEKSVRKIIANIYN